MKKFLTLIIGIVLVALIAIFLGNWLTELYANSIHQ